MNQYSYQKNTSLLKACLVLPTYNEAENIELIIKAIFSTQSIIKTHQLYVVVVDDNSPDNTQKIVKQQMKEFPNLHLITGNKIGLGDAYKRGMSFAIKTFNPDLLLQMDADGQHDTKLIPEFINLSHNGFSLVIGSRFVPGGETPDFSILRKFLSITGNFLIRHLGKAANVKDCTSGFRCIKTDLVLKCDLENFSTRGYSFQSTLVCELIRNGAKPIEVPIIFKKRMSGQSKLTLRDQIEFLVNIAKITYRYSEDFIKYCLVGLVGVIVNLGTYLLLNRYFQIPLQLASLIAVEASIVSNFILNNYWTFKQREKTLSMLRRLIYFHVAAGISGILFYYLLFLFLTMILNVNDIFSILLATVIGTISNYTINSLWTWKK